MIWNRLGGNSSGVTGTRLSEAAAVLVMAPAAAWVGYDGALAAARAALRFARWEEAESLLMWASAIAAEDAAFLNLLGVLWEVRGHARAARRCYGRAIRADGHYAPAQQNMRRLFELRQFGRTREVVALGDEA